jgi:hypothetical protein
VPLSAACCTCAAPHTLHIAADAPSEDQSEEVILDENKRKEEGKHSFYMVSSGCRF